MIDSHCHLQYDYSPKTAANLVDEANQAGVHTLVTIGTDLDSIPKVQAISEAHPCVYHTVGVHPHDAFQLNDQDLELIRRAATHPKCVALGEVGLDYFYENAAKEIQRRDLECQLDLAADLKKPVVIHSRDGEADLLALLKRHAARFQGPEIGVIHCFTGSESFGRECLDLGFRISFSGILTFKNAEEIRKSALAFPLERLCVETDAPFLAPIPYRGKKCEPAMVKQTALKLSEVKRCSLEEVIAKTTESAQALYGLTFIAQSGL